MRTTLSAAFVFICLIANLAAAQGTGSVVGTVKDETGGVLPGVTVVIRTPAGMSVAEAVTDSSGTYRFANVPSGRYAMQFTLVNFAPVNHDELVIGAGETRNDEVMQLTLNAEVIVV